MDELKEMIGEELFNQLVAKLGDKKLMIDNNNFVPLSKLNDANAKIKGLTEQVEGFDKQLKDLKKNAEGNEELVKQIEAQQKQNKEQKESFEKELAKLQKKSALKESLREHGAKYPDLLADKFDLDKIELENEKVKDAESIIKPYKESYKDLFGVSKIGGEPPKEGNPPQPKGALVQQLEEAYKRQAPLPEIMALKRQIQEQSK